MISLQKIFEQTFAVLVLFFYTGGIAPFIGTGHPLAPLLLILPHAAASTTLVLLALRWQQTLKTLMGAPLLWLLMLIVVLSPFWSEVPSQTLNETLPLLRVTLFSLYLAARYSFKEILQLVAWALGMAAALSLVFGAALPSYGVMGRGYIGQFQDWMHEGAWRGIYVHKTLLGTFMALTILVCGYLVSWKNALRPLAFVTLLVATLVLLMSTTKAALVTALVVFMCVPLYRSFRWKPARLILFWSVSGTLLALGIVGFAANAPAILAAIGRNTTLSGRTDFWPLVVENIGQRLWLGYGYHTFWLNGWEGSAANVWVYLPQGFEPPHAHNGYLEILLGLGAVGFGVFLLNLGHYSYRSFCWARAHPGLEGLVPMLFLTFMLLVNVTESLWIDGDFLWVCFSTLTLAIAQNPQPQLYWEIQQLPEEGAYV